MIFNEEELIKSPMNYVGGKYKLLPQILPLLPDKINTTVDLFCGGLDFAINIKSDKIICNDIIKPMINMYQSFKNTNISIIIQHIENNIKEFNLSKTNKEGYLKLREQYNINNNSFDLMTLISYCYNNKIRFNSKWEFNNAFGENRSEFNQNMKNNLVDTVNKIQNSNILFTNLDFLNFDFTQLNENDLVYVDPPYLITNADYRIPIKWNNANELKLLQLLDELSSKNIKFALSNVIEHDNKTNDILLEWSNKYNIHHLNHKYNNANADKKIKSGKSKEVLITNY